MATTRKLTAKQTALMTAIGEKYFSFFDEGIVEGGGIWSGALTEEIAGSTKYDVSDTPKGAARVMVSLEKRGLLVLSEDSEGDDGVWVELTEEGAKVANELAGNSTDEEENRAGQQIDEAIQAIIEHTDVEIEDAGFDEAEEEDLVGEIEELLEPVHIPVADRVFVPETEEVEEANSLSITTTHSTDTYTVREWTDGDDVEWTETDFADGSRTIKRRKKVSGSWRTDYWGAEFKGDAERYTTAKFAKMARAYGSFSHNPISE